MNTRTREQWFFHFAKRALNCELYRTAKLHGQTVSTVRGLENKVEAFLSQHDDAILRAAYDRYIAVKP